MINGIRLIRGIGQFEADGGTAAPAAQFGKFNVIYASNGRGKTTLSAILRSHATGEADPITERARFGCTLQPEVVLECAGTPTHARYHDGTWSHCCPDVIIFDDHFVEENIYSGLTVGPEHRKNLHELIIGAAGVALARQFDDLTAQIATATRDLQAKSIAIPSTIRGQLSVDDFCALTCPDGIATLLQEAEHTAAAHRQAGTIRNTSGLPQLELPEIDTEAITSLLVRGLPTLQATAFASVQEHFAQLGEGGEQWVAAGMEHIAAMVATEHGPACPFCAQPLQESPLFAAYLVYFSEAYAELKQDIADALATITVGFSGDALAAFHRSAHTLQERHRFWSDFCSLRECPMLPEEIARVWTAARDAVVRALQQKQLAPIASLQLQLDDLRSIQEFANLRDSINEINNLIDTANSEITRRKEQTAVQSGADVELTLTMLKLRKQRSVPATAELCDAYTAAKNHRDRLVAQKEGVGEQLRDHNARVFPEYQAHINHYLARFGAGFRIVNVEPRRPGGVLTASYQIEINATQVPVDTRFKDTLSAGDRNTLALAFFLAQLDQDPQLANRVVVIDDPKSSLDNHRESATVREISELVGRTAQVVVMSHDKAFLCHLWERVDRVSKSSLMVRRSQRGSRFEVWDVSADCITEYDRRHQLLRTYLADGTGDERHVAEAIRPLLEGYLRVAYPSHCKPGTLLGKFLVRASNEAAANRQFISPQACAELDELRLYANQFHHDTNPAWQTQSIDPGELETFVRRTLEFVTPS